jgi:hypothetical protein
VFAEVLMVRLDIPDPVSEVGLNKQVAPLGKPEQDSVTMPSNPNNGTLVTVEVGELPATTIEGDKADAVNPKPLVVL